MSFNSSIIVDPSWGGSLILPPSQNHGMRALGREMRRQVHATERGPHGSGSGRSYESAQNTRFNRDWLTSHMSGDAAISAGWDMLTRRARDLVRNEPWAAQACERITQNVIGSEGIRTESEIEFADGTLDEDTNKEFDTAFRRWAEQADAEGEMHLAEMQALGMRETPEVGEVFYVACSDPDPKRLIPLCYQVIEAEQLATMFDRPRTAGDNRIKRGIEYDKFGKPVAYYFWVDHPYDLQVVATDTVRVPASRVIHYYERKRPSQRRGVTWFAPILQTLRDLSQYIGDEMTAARVSSWFTVAIKRASGAGTGLGLGDGSDYDESGNPLEGLGPGIIADLGKDDEIQSIQSNRPNSASEPWIRLILNSMANGLGMTYLSLSGDVEKANFSAAQFAKLIDKVVWRTLQGRFGRRVPLRMRREVAAQLVAFGHIPSLSATQFRADPNHWLATRLLPPGWEDFNPVVEVNAAIARIQGGLSTLQDECAGRGRNWRQVLMQRSRELDLAESLEVPLSSSQPDPAAKPVVSRDPTQKPGKPNPDDPGAEPNDDTADDTVEETADAE